MYSSRKNPYPPHGRSLEIPIGRGVLKVKILEAKYEAKLEFPRGTDGYILELHNTLRCKSGEARNDHGNMTCSIGISTSVCFFSQTSNGVSIYCIEIIRQFILICKMITMGHQVIHGKVPYSHPNNPNLPYSHPYVTMNYMPMGLYCKIRWDSRMSFGITRFTGSNLK